MKKIVWFLMIVFLSFSTNIVSAEENCLGIHSSNNTYSCGIGDGNCTWWAAHKRPDLNFSYINGKPRNAIEWIWYAQQNEMAIGNSPVVGSVVVFRGYTDNQGNNYGHVAYVESVNNDGSFNVSQMDYYGSWGQGINHQTFTNSSLNGVLGFILPNECVSNADGGIVCQHGVHTHIIHSEYRCSNNQCWEPGGETNCWDAHSWYTIVNGNVFGTKTIRDRSMCSAVYNAGDSNDGTGGGSIPPSQIAPNNLTQDTDIFGPEGVERKAEFGNPVYAGETITVRTEICAENGNTSKARKKGGSKTDTLFEVKNPSGDWQEFASTETKDENLTDGNCHVEKATYVIPNVVGSQIGFRAKIDARDEIKETDEADNKSRDEIFGIYNPPFINLMAHSVGTQSVGAGSSFRISYKVSNIGTIQPSTDITSRSEIKVNGLWQFVASDNTKAAHLAPGNNHDEDMAGTAPSTTGTYSVRACADIPNKVNESNELDNCSNGTLTVVAPPPPTIHFTNPSPGEKWKSKKIYTIRWNSSNMPRGERIRIDYYNYGRWTTVSGAHNTTNDGSKHWKMRNNRTKDDRYSRLRIVRLSDGKVIGVSHTFFIDRKKGTPEW